jgi:hypothetical protein
LDGRLPNQVEGDDFLGFAVLEDFKILEGQAVDESLPVEDPDRDLDVDDPRNMAKLLGMERDEEKAARAQEGQFRMNLASYFSCILL